MAKRHPPIPERRLDEFRQFDWSTLAVLFCLLLGVVVSLWRIGFPSRQERLLRAAAHSYLCEDYHSAERLASAAIDLDPESDRGWVLAGAAVAKLKRSDDAIKLFSHVREAADFETRLAATEGLAERQLSLGHSADAERNLRQILKLDPQRVWANWQLAYLLQIEGRCWESLPNVRHSLAHRATGVDELILLGTPERVFIRHENFVEKCQIARPDDPLPLLGESRHALLRANRDRAREILERIISARPDSLEAQARWGRLRLELDGADELTDWNARLPDNADSHPEIWVTRGYWMKDLARDRDALACFAEAIRLFPDHVGATYQLSQLLATMGDATSAERFATRSAQLSKLEYIIDELREAPQFDRIQEAFELLISLGRISEALGWCRVTLMYHDRSEWANAAVRKYHYLWTETWSNPLGGISATLLTRPDFPKPRSKNDMSVTPAQADIVSTTFRDDALASGLAFQYVNGTTETSGLEHMLQAPGAGCGALDYDGDSWPDIYFCQSGVWPVDPLRNPSVDRLFRNRGDGFFADVTENSGLGDGEFSQGLAAGDFDNDGFCDLFVGNVGRDRLYHNNGDGTFSDITSSAHVAGEVDWTTSAAFADLNGDGLPDLYVVHYLVLEEVLKRACKSNGRPMGCAPTMFSADQDRLYLNQGDGRFIDQTEASGIVARDGKGLGIVVADFQNRGQLDVFIGNDTAANFFFVNATTKRGGSPLFREEGLLRGLALNEDGMAQACMGIGCEDADGDGQMDLYVTNFYADYNTLYLQKSDQTFGDMTHRAGLREPTFNLLGFGTQFIDADLDGWPDLVVANGHVDRTFSTGVADAMSPQFFRNVGGTPGKTRYVETPASVLGPYFQRKLLGRSMARLDWNGDGQEDVCIVHLDAPATLLTNTTSQTGNWVALRLHGTTSARDAVGARILLTAGGRTWMRQVTAGDGYMSVNEQRVVFGVGKNSQIDQIEIIWPSGSRELYGNLTVGSELIAVEGTHRLLELRREIQ